MHGIELQEARRDRILFYGLIDGGEDDDVVLGYLGDDAAAGQAGYDFVFALERLGGGEEREQ
jgi:hypothetical protein